jgi:hypothetical protein
MLFTETPLLLMAFGTVVINKAVLLAESTNTMTNASSIGEAAQTAGRLAFEAFNANWVELTSGKSQIYFATVKTSLAVATTLIAFWAVPFINTIIHEGYSDKTIEELIYPLVVVFMLAVNNGYLLSSTSLFFRNTTNYVNSQILETTINGIKIEQAIRQSNLNQAFKQILSEKVVECRLQPSNSSFYDIQDGEQRGQSSKGQENNQNVDSQTVCIENAIKDVVQAAEEYNAKNQASSNFNIVDELKKAVRGGAEAIAKIPAQYVNSYVQGALLVIFPTLQMGFVFLIEIASLLNAYVAPIFVALSLIPGQGKLIYVWLSGWLALALVKVSYTIIIGIATSSIVNVEDTNPLLLPLILGVLSPILALAIASGGGMALFNGLSSAGGGSLRLLLRGRIPRKN